MIGRLRLALALAAFMLVTPVLALYQALALATGLFDERKAPRAWHRFVARLLGIRVRAFGQPDPRRPLLLASNHTSWTDIIVLGSLANVQFIAKSEVAGWPVFGWLAKLQRTVFVNRAARGQSAAQAGLVATRLEAGTPLVLFSEGTTSDGNGVLPFNSTLFAAADLPRTGGAVTVQPVAIAYTRLHGMPAGRQHRRRLSWIGDQELVPHLTGLLTTGGVDVEVHFGPVIAFGQGARRKEVARAAEASVRAMLSAALRDPAR